MRLLKSGYLEQNYKHIPGTDPDDRIVYMLEADLEARTEGPPEVGDVLVLENIYYDFNKSAIRTGDTRELESLAQMMLKYPAMTIELQSHTDARGTDDYNMELATRRGESVRDFLLLRGVSADRVHLKPMGEGQLRNHCKDGVTCTDDEHQKNRRTEIKILTVDPKLEVRFSDQR
jgi:outer membrane protein OmpA-like peptidoglycan-associated protein